MKIFILIATLITPMLGYATSPENILCKGMALVEKDTRLPIRVWFESDQEGRVDSHTEVGDWYTLVNPVTSDETIGGERTIARIGRNANGPLTLFSLVIKNPMQSQSSATLTQTFGDKRPTI